MECDARLRCPFKTAAELILALKEQMFDLAVQINPFCGQCQSEKEGKRF